MVFHLLSQLYISKPVYWLWPNDAIWRHRSESSLSRVMACCMTAKSHTYYLNRCRLKITSVQWHLPESNFTRNAHELNPRQVFGDFTFKFTATPANELATLCNSWNRSTNTTNHRVNKCSSLMHRIKIKSPANFLWNEQNFFVGGSITFQSVLLWRYYNDKKPTGYWRYYHSRCRPARCHGRRHGAWRPHHER